MADLALEQVVEARRQWENWWDESWGEKGSRCGAVCLVKDLDGDRVVVPVLCAMWSCPVCGLLKRWWFRRNVIKAVEDHGLNRMWTLTLRHDGAWEESWKLISEAWARLRQECKRRWRHFEFIWVVEPQKDGYAHLHVLVNVWIHQHQLSELWERYTGGSYIVWVQKVSAQRVSDYISKYMSKLAGRPLTLGAGELVNKHRFGKSQKVVFTPFRLGSEGWLAYGESFKDVIRKCKAKLVSYEMGGSAAPVLRFSEPPGGGLMLSKLRDSDEWLLAGQMHGFGRDPPGGVW